MLNKNNERELAYLVVINDITPIEGADRVELAHINGWRVMVRKDQFKVGDLAIYFEIDSKVPATETFEFLAPKHYKVKTQKYFKGTVISQGLLMSADDFGWTLAADEDGKIYMYNAEDNEYYYESEFLTKKLGVKYADADDNIRKARSVDLYKKMAQHHGKLFSHQPFKWLMKRTWGQKLLFVFFGRAEKKRNSWPAWVKKTDEERVQNMPWILENKDPWIMTEKIDGTSTTFTMKRKRFGGYEFYVCSRNVVFDKPDKQCFYDTNVYLEMAERYDVYNVLKNIMDACKEYDWITLQGETYGDGIQKRSYNCKDHNFMAFNFITSTEGRWDSVRASAFLNTYKIPWVPILDENFILPDTVEELLDIATGESVCDKGLREGLVFRSKDGLQSFKAVSNEFLLKYHAG